MISTVPTKLPLAFYKKDRIYVPPLLKDLTEVKHRMEEAVAFITPDLLTEA